MDGHDYLIKYRDRKSEDWQDVRTLIGEEVVFASLDDAETILQHLVTMDGVLEGVVIDEDGTVVQYYEKGVKRPKPN